MKITYTSILSAICSSILLLGFLSVYIWKKQENYSLYEVKLLIFCTVLTGVRLFFPIDICGISHTIGIKILYPELCRFMRGKIGFLSHFSVLFLISLLGSFLILVQKSLSYISFIKLIKEIRPIEYIRVKKYKKVKKIPILKVDSIEDPFIVGIKNPYIIIPNIDEETKKIVLLHEVGHYIKRDLFLKKGHTPHHEIFKETLCLRLHFWAASDSFFQLFHAENLCHRRDHFHGFKHKFVVQCRGCQQGCGNSNCDGYQLFRRQHLGHAN